MNVIRASVDVDRFPVEIDLKEDITAEKAEGQVFYGTEAQAGKSWVVTGLGIKVVVVPTDTVRNLYLSPVGPDTTIADVPAGNLSLTPPDPS